EQRRSMVAEQRRSMVAEQRRSMVAEQRRSMVAEHKEGRLYTSMKFRFHMTERCQLRCEYCYLSAGEAGKSLPIEIAKQALQTYLPKNYRGQVEVEFHGGGEPTLAFEAIKAIVEEVRALPITPQFRLQTNGLVPREVLDWLLREQVQLSVSIDGSAQIQQLQRPGAKGAYQQMLDTIETLVGAKVSFNTISVVSDYSLHFLEESYELFKSLGVRNMLFNPLHELGRASQGTLSHQKAVDIMAFVQKFLAIRLRADQEGIRVMSDFLPDFYHYHPRDFQCNACRPSMCVHVNGDLVACTRAYDVLPRDQNPFIWAKYEEGIWQMDESKKTALENRTLENMPACQSCLVKWDCAGDCLIELYKKTGDFYQVDKVRCEAKRWFVQNYLSAFSDNFLA
ncbi:MAG: radical SAM protein, partial [Candidatus Margulisiibacteriota bacterium]